MARLNESAAPVESLESLKRRFVRQNREIARVNSIQSLRIRSLESEVSHLLAENVSLREQVISLGHELERFEAAKLLSDGVYDIKAKLDSKLAELNNIVSNLGALPRNFNKAVSQNDADAARNVSAQHSPALNPQPEPNQDIEEDGRLPVILEDKYYPRKTLEANELRELANENVSDAFRLGTQYLEDNAPPDLHEDSLDSPLHDDDAELNAHFLPPTLETRKKKRPSPSLFEEEDLSRLDHDSTTPKKDSRYSLKSGAKRKFSYDEDEEFQPISTADDDFQFSRPNQSPEDTEDLSLSAKEESPVKRQTHLKERRKNIAPPKRKALEPKSTNTRMVSPRRPRKGISLDRSKRTLTSANSQDDEDRNLRAAISTDQHDPHYKSLSEDLDHDDTKAAERKELENIGAVSEPQTSQEPQFDLSDTPTEQAETSSRPTRRQRAVVSYAEPNLRAKMRRPTSEFIAAVGGDQGRRVSGSQPSRKSVAADECSSRKGGSDNGRKSREPEPTPGRSESPSRGLEGETRDDTLPPSISVDRKHQKESDNQIREPRAPEENKRSTKNTLRALSSLNKQSRRHSSNPTAATKVSSMDSQQTFDSAAALLEGTIQQQAEFMSSEAGLDEPTTSLGADLTRARRGQRAASRRKSMMI